MLVLCAALFNYISLFAISVLFRLNFDDLRQMIFDLDQPNQMLAFKVHNAFSSIGTWVFTAWFFLYFKRWRFGSFIRTNGPVNKIDWAYILLVLVGGTFVSAYLIQINSKIPFFTYLQDQMEDGTGSLMNKILVMNSTGDLMTNLLFLALVPAITEEIFFRGLFQNLLIKSTGNHHLGIAITSMLFAGIHLNPTQFISMLFLAAMLGYTYYYSGSIWISIFLHFANNALAVLVNYYYNSSVMAKELADDKFNPNLIVVLGSFSLCMAALYFMSKRKEKDIYE